MNNIENVVFQKDKGEEVQVVPLEVGMILSYFKIEDAIKDAKEMEGNGVKVKIRTYPEGFCKATIEILELSDDCESKLD